MQVLFSNSFCAGNININNEFAETFGRAKQCLPAAEEVSVTHGTHPLKGAFYVLVNF